MAKAYADGVSGILHQMQAADLIVVLKSAELCKVWMKRAVAVMEAVRGANHKETKKLGDLQADCAQTDQMSVAANMLENDMAFLKKLGRHRSEMYAVQMGDLTPFGSLNGFHIHPLNQRYCRDALKKIHKGRKLKTPNVSVRNSADKIA